MKITIFKTPKPRRFEYQPRYYDEREERRQRTKQIADSLRDSDSDTLDMDQVRTNIRDRWTRGRKAHKSEIMGSRISSLVVLLVVLFLLAYFIFFVPIF